MFSTLLNGGCVVQDNSTKHMSVHMRQRKNIDGAPLVARNSRIDVVAAAHANDRTPHCILVRPRPKVKLCIFNAQHGLRHVFDLRQQIFVQNFGRD